MKKQSATDILTEAIRHIRRTHMNTYSWSMSVSDEEAIDILSASIVKVEANEIISCI